MGVPAPPNERPRHEISAIWGNAENIYSLGVLPPVTQTGPACALVQRLRGL
jgi:hypothetical protein